MDQRLARRLIRRLEGVPPSRVRRLRAAFLPDFFVDHFVDLGSWKTVVPRLKGVHDRGGGNLQRVAQRLRPGGNAANAALALARLGPRVSLIAETDAAGLAILRDHARASKLDASRVRLGRVASLTTALEFGHGATNVMLSQPGPVQDFGPDRLADGDWDLLEGCDVVGVVNWAQNIEGGTGLARTVFRRVRAAGGSTFFDLGDASARLDDLPSVRKNVLGSGWLDAWGFNENELRLIAGSRAAASRPQTIGLLRRLGRRWPVRLDFHAPERGATVQDGELVEVPAVPVERRRSTGAGDAWNAGNILADLLGLAADERLLLAHAVAAYYVSAPEPRHPSLPQVIRFLRVLR